MLIQNVMRIGETFATFVCINELTQFEIINLAIIVNKIARYIVAPELPTLNLTNLCNKLLPIYTALGVRNLAPVKCLRTGLSVATFIIEWAGCRAGCAVAGAGGDGSRLSVAGDQGESGVHRGGVVNCAYPTGWEGGSAIPLVPLNQLSLPEVLLLETLNKCAGNATTMGADCGVFNLTPQRILIGVCILFGGELVTIDCTHGLQKLALLNVIADPTVSSNKGAEVSVTFATILQKINNTLRKFMTKVRRKFRQNDILKGNKFGGFINNGSSRLCHCLTQTQKKVGDLFIVASHLNGGAVVGDRDGFHGLEAVSASVVRRWWKYGTPEPTPSTTIVPLIELAQHLGLVSILVYLIGTTSTNGRRVSLLNNTSSRNLPKNNSIKKKEKRDQAPPRSLQTPSPMRYDYLFSFRAG